MYAQSATPAWVTLYPIMTDERSEVPAWTRSPWVKWSFLLLLVVIIAQSLNYHWRVLPTSAAGYFARGRGDYLHGEWTSAAANFSKSIDLQPDDADSYIWRGYAYLRLRDHARAMPDLERATTLRPEYVKAHAALGDGKAANLDTAGAIAEYSRALATDPNYSKCYLARGMSLYDAKRWEDAAADLRKGASMLLEDKQVTANFLLWLARARGGDPDGATAELRGVMKSGRLRGQRFITGARFLCGELAEPDFLVAMPEIKGGDANELKAEAFFLAGAKRFVDGDQEGALTLMRACLETGADTSYAYDRARATVPPALRPGSSAPTR